MACLTSTTTTTSSSSSFQSHSGTTKRKYSSKKQQLSYCCFAVILLTVISKEAGGSHIMTSESKEAEFEMIHTNAGEESEERLKKKKTLLKTSNELGSDKGNIPPMGSPPVAPPHLLITPDNTNREDGEGQVDSTGGSPPKIPLHLGGGSPLDEETIRELDEKTSRLRKIEELSTGLISEQCVHEFEMMRDVKLSTEFANVIMEKVDMIVSFLYKLKKYESRIKNKKELERDESEVYKYVLETVKEAYSVKNLRLLIHNSQTSDQTLFTLGPPSSSSSSYSSSSSSSSKQSFLHSKRNNAFLYLRDDPGQLKPKDSHVLLKSRLKSADLERQPWYFNPNAEFDHSRFMDFADRPTPKSSYHHNKLMDGGMNGGSYWSWPYFNCSNAKNQKAMDESQLIIRSSPPAPKKQFLRASSSNPNSGEKESEMDEAEEGEKSGESHSHKLHPPAEPNPTRSNSWLASYTAWFPIRTKERIVEEYGELSLDLDISTLEINPCGFSSEQEKDNDMITNPLVYFRDSHKCDRVGGTSVCHFIPGNPWRLGSYECRCRRNMYAYNRALNNTIPGGIAEAAWMTMRENKTNGHDSIMYQDIVTCKACPDGCENCVDGVSCLAPSSLVFRIVLLSVSVICSFGSLALILVTYKFRKKPVLKSSSPLFHGITLCGCVLMYSEMIALFPVLTQTTCIAVKWTRHLGFCVTYTALYMKLCRVFLTFRVKSAHKIKLTEKHLLHWMSPVMVVMLLYLFAWTISDPPSIEPMYTTHHLKFFQCVYNWWDHSLAIGEVIFLGYGVWICWRIRENPDAQFISYSIYNIAFTNVIMVSLHLLIAPQAGPDTKYLLAFMRTQLSTTVTIALVFGSKLLTVLRGDPKALKDIPTSANGFGHETLDLEEENQQLKEELTKMATQIEKLKSYAMCKNNPHLKHSSMNVNVTTTESDNNKLDAYASL